MGENLSLFFFGFLMGAAIIAAIVSFTIRSDHQVICEYEGGEVQGEVCIVDGKVFDIG